MKYINSFFKTIVAVFLMLIIIIFYIPVAILFPTKIYGRKNLRGLKSGAVVACNHFSNVDPIILKVRLFLSAFQNTFLGKIEMNKFKPLGWFLSCFGIIYINRQSLDRKAMKEVDKNLKNGKRVVIFPEGTRNKTNSTELQAVKSGVVFFAKRADVPLIPMRIEKKPRLFRLNRIYVGEPYKIGEDGEISTADEVTKLEQKMNELLK